MSHQCIHVLFIVRVIGSISVANRLCEVVVLDAEWESECACVSVRRFWHVHLDAMLYGMFANFLGVFGGALAGVLDVFHLTTFTLEGSIYVL